MTAGGGSEGDVPPTDHAGERRPRVFLSYTADGDASALELKEMLGAHDIVVSDVPESSPVPSNGRWSQLVDEVRTSDFFVALVSPDYATHTATLAEAALAAKARVSGSLGSIIPLQMGRETEIPALLLPYRLMDVRDQRYRQLLDVLLGRERWTDLDGSAFDEVVGQIDSIVAERDARTSWVRAQSAIRSSVWASGASFLAFAGIFVTSVSLSASVGLQFVLGAVALIAFGSNSFSAYKLGWFEGTTRKKRR